MTSVIHICYRLSDGSVSALLVGGGAPDDALRVIAEALESGAVSIAVTREDVVGLTEPNENTQ